MVKRAVCEIEVLVSSFRVFCQFYWIVSIPGKDILQYERFIEEKEDENLF